MRTVLNTINNAQDNLGLTGNNKASAVGGYKKIGQSILNGFTHIALFVRDAGVYSDEVLEQPRDVKTVWIDHDAAKVKAYDADIAALEVAIDDMKVKVEGKGKKADKKRKSRKKARKALKETLAQLELTRTYYTNTLSKAHKL